MARDGFKAIFFDLDGTLVDIHGPLYIASRRALEDLGHTPALTQELYWEAISQNNLLLRLPENLRRDFTQLAFAYFVAEIDATERMEVLPHVADTLGEVKRRGYTTGVITSRPGDPKVLVEKLAMVGLAAHLDHVVTQETASLRALDKTASLIETARRAEVPAEQCLYVGDEPRDVMAARNASYGAAIAVATGPAPYDHLCNHPEFRPDVVMRSMSELLPVVKHLEDGLGGGVEN